MSKLDRERFGVWLKDPVTVLYMQELEAIEKELIERCGNGGCHSERRPLPEIYEFYQGSISSMRQAHNPHVVLSAVLADDEQDDKEVSDGNA